MHRSKFFESFQSKTEGLHKNTTKWADITGDHNYLSSQSYGRGNAQLSEHDAGSDEDNVESPKASFLPDLLRTNNKMDPPPSSSVFANRPISALLRPDGQKEIKAPTFKPTTLTVRPKALDQQSSSQDLSAILAKLSSMENKMTSLIESKISSLERKLDASEKRAASTIRAIESIGTVVENQIANGLKISRDDLEAVMHAINNCTKESGSILSAQIDEMSEKIANKSSQVTSNDASEIARILDNEVVVVTSNNPHDTVHKVSTEELLLMIPDSATIYVCSTIDELKRDLYMVREADIAEEQDALPSET